MTNAPTTRAEAEQLGDVVGQIAFHVARSLCETWPHLDLEQLVGTFTRPVATEGIARRYLAALDAGCTTAQAAGETGAALIHAWADARLAAAKAARTA
ncbi:hypothetical protein ACIBAC_00655 [Streptomyces sp. NPDC051362]|uniref:hypothetical protein n=1 Tax=Streptomyces sp. NPDC051362 TaxID=3365651 RepID=UPI0037AB93BE